MGASFCSYRSRLYRKAVLAVILGLVCLGATLAAAQYAKKTPSTKGPRALGLLEMASNGKAHLVPVTIVLDGRFYDAGAYKADPVPMALQSETVYEALKTGVSQGLFTVAGALHSKDGWIADGKWRSTADLEADKARAKGEAEKLAKKPTETEQGPPKLHRGPPGGKPPLASEPPASSTQNPTTAPEQETKTSAEKPSQAQSKPPDSDRPVLRHQAASETTHEQTKAGGDSEPLKGPIQLIPAISDADGPDPRPYSYQMKPEEEQTFLKKMLAMAGDEVRARAAHSSAETAARSKTPPQFQDVQLRVFDLSNTNEPVLVLTAYAKVASDASDLQYITVVVAREDIYGDLHKVFAQTTDDQHLDVLPKYELIDAVDADGDGRGELLFRMTWDSGSAFSVYRVIGDKLWPLFEGKPGA